MTWVNMHLDRLIGVLRGRINASIYDTIFLTTHQYGFHNKGAGAEGARPFVVISFLVDGEKYGDIYGAIYPTSYDTN